MSRSRSGFYNTIEYIGPRPQKPKRRNFFGGWVIIVIALGMGFWFGRPLMPFLKAANVEPSPKEANVLIDSLGGSKKFGDALARAALGYSMEDIKPDRTYFTLGYPNGDIPSGLGSASDVIIRCFRRADPKLDLQVLVHEDMTENFRLYPQLWPNSPAPDTNIDHRRVPNLQRFFERKGQTLPSSRDAADYETGDIVVWSLSNAESHIGIVVPGPGGRSDEPWIVHDMGAGVKWENVLFDYSIQGHFRFPHQETSAGVEK